MSSSNDRTRPVQRRAAEHPAPGATPAADASAPTGPHAGGPATSGPTTTGPVGEQSGVAAERPAPERPAAGGTGKRAATPPPEQEPAPGAEAEVHSGGKTAGLWISLVLGAIVLILLLIFVIQNNVTAGIQYFGASFDLPLGVAMLLAAIAGALVMALVGSVRMIQMGWMIRKLRKQLAKIQKTAR